MEKIYDLVIADEPAELIEIVNEAIKQGYSPIGGLLSVQEKLIQAIVYIGSGGG